MLDRVEKNAYTLILYVMFIGIFFKKGRWNYYAKEIKYRSTR